MSTNYTRWDWMGGILLRHPNVQWPTIHQSHAVPKPAENYKRMGSFHAYQMARLPFRLRADDTGYWPEIASQNYPFGYRSLGLRPGSTISEGQLESLWCLLALRRGLLDAASGAADAAVVAVA